MRAAAPPRTRPPACERTAFRFVPFRSVPFQTETSRFKNQPFQKLLLLPGLVIHPSVKRSTLGLTE
eukprot:COSAG06_NODE_4396_length_4300_cov_24.967151_7_plen_66_part_00